MNIIFKFTVITIIGIFSGCSNSYSHKDRYRTDESIQEEFQSHQKEIFDLFINSSNANPELNGKIIFDISLTPDGKVLTCSVYKTSIHEKKLISELINLIQTINFDPDEQGKSYRFLYPIEFER